MWRGLAVGPLSWRDAETAHPMKVQAARRAVKDEPTKLPLEIGFHVQEFEAQHLRWKRGRV